MVELQTTPFVASEIYYIYIQCLHFTSLHPTPPPLKPQLHPPTPTHPLENKSNQLPVKLHPSFSSTEKFEWQSRIFCRVKDMELLCPTVVVTSLICINTYQPGGEKSWLLNFLWIILYSLSYMFLKKELGLNSTIYMYLLLLLKYVK